MFETEIFGPFLVLKLKGGGGAWPPLASPVATPLYLLRIRNSSSTKDLEDRDKIYSTETIAHQPKKVVDSKVKINKNEILFNMFFPLIPVDDLRNVYKWVNNLFSERIVPNSPLAGRLKHFWKHVRFLQRTQKFWKFCRVSTYIF